MKLKKQYLVKFIVIALLASVSLVISCKKDDPAPNTTTNPPVTNPPEDTTTIKPGVDPTTAATVGFFLDSWESKTFSAPQYNAATIPITTTTTVTVDAGNIMAKIPVTAFGHNANTWMTSMVDQSDFMTHITALKPNVIRFPAGSGSDVYFWNSKPGELPADVPLNLDDKDGVKKDPGFGFGKTTDNWRASLDNYYLVLQQTNSVGLLTMNYGYARYGTSADPVATAAHLAADWVRYDNGRTKFWEIGNEVYADWEWSYRIDQSLNKDGQPLLITGKLYAQHFKVFADSMRKAATDIGATIYIGAVMYESEPASWQADSFKNWNTLMLPELNNKPDFYIGHNYFTPYNENSTAATVLNAALTEPSKMITFMKSTMQSNGATVKPVAMTEYNMWAQGSKQQVSNTSGVFAALVVCEAIKNNYGLTARWDLLNSWADGNDHGLFSDGNEPNVAKWTPRPSFHYLYYLQRCMGDRMVGTTVPSTNTAIKAYASTFTSGETSTVLANISATSQSVELKFKNFKIGDRYYWYTLEGSTDNGEFSRKVLINGSGPTQVAGGPSNYTTIKARSAVTTGGVKVTVPARSIVFLVVEKGV
ncbi:MAG TPA: hypothetical protein VL443_03025 [Cyclobacteriaceae bacterium]|nr:hypothetical protein [Cyclobacteriaceae bacterium]